MAIDLKVGQRVSYMHYGTLGYGEISRILVDYYVREIEYGNSYLGGPDGYIISEVDLYAFPACVEGEKGNNFYILKENFIEKEPQILVTGNLTVALESWEDRIENSGWITEIIPDEKTAYQMIAAIQKSEAECRDGISLQSMYQPQYEDDEETVIEKTTVLGDLSWLELDKP